MTPNRFTATEIMAAKQQHEAFGENKLGGPMGKLIMVELFCKIQK